MALVGPLGCLDCIKKQHVVSPSQGLAESLILASKNHCHADQRRQLLPRFGRDAHATDTWVQRLPLCDQHRRMSATGSEELRLIRLLQKCFPHSRHDEPRLLGARSEQIDPGICSMQHRRQRCVHLRSTLAEQEVAIRLY